jgi:diaminopimelate decarboxylase
VPETPHLTIDLARVRDNFRRLQAVLPNARIRYAVKANPAEPILRVLAAEGAAFDVASVGEIEACFSAGIDGRLLTFGNTIKKPSAVAQAYARGVRRFAFDTEHDVATIAEHVAGNSG